MLRNARRANPAVPWRILWLALGLIVFTTVITILVIVLATSSSTSSGQTLAPAAPAVAPAAPAVAPAAPAGSVGTGCPHRQPAVPRSDRAGADSAVVPAGARSVLLCRYVSVGARLVRHRLVASAPAVTRLASELNALPSATGAYACPNDTGEEVVAHFRYPGGPADPVTIGLSGCQTVTNGRVHRLGLDRRVIGRVAALVPVLGTIRGHLKVCGGPYPGRCGTTTFTSCYGSSRCFTADRVAAFVDNGPLVRSARLRRARFTLRLPPGRYTLKLLGDGRHVHGHVIQTMPARVRFRHTTRIVFVIAIP